MACHHQSEVYTQSDRMSIADVQSHECSSVSTMLQGHVDDCAQIERRVLDLTEQEHGMLMGCLRGIGKATIASELGVATSTVEHGLLAIRRKLGLSNTAQLLRIAARAGIDGAISNPNEVWKQLSEDEQQIVIGLHEGKSQTSIAESMGINPRVLEYRLRALKKRLGLDDLPSTLLVQCIPEECLPMEQVVFCVDGRTIFQSEETVSITEQALPDSIPDPNATLISSLPENNPRPPAGIIVLPSQDDSAEASTVMDADALEPLLDPNTEQPIDADASDESPLHPALALREEILLTDDPQTESPLSPQIPPCAAAIRKQNYNWSPEPVSSEHFHATQALPGSTEKLAVLAQRYEAGLPFWHPADRINYEDPEEHEAEAPTALHR